MRFNRQRSLEASLAVTLAAALLLSACGAGDDRAAPGAAPDSPFATGPLPAEGYKAALSFVDPPARLRAGEAKTIQVKVRNASPVHWKVRGAGPDNRYFIAVGNRWFRADGTTLITSADGRIGLPENLAPGQETSASLVIKAPQEPGDYVLDLDLVQEQVTWFNERGSETVKTKVTVVK